LVTWDPRNWSRPEHTHVSGHLLVEKIIYISLGTTTMKGKKTKRECTDLGQFFGYQVTKMGFLPQTVYVVQKTVYMFVAWPAYRPTVPTSKTM